MARILKKAINVNNVFFIFYKKKYPNIYIPKKKES